MNQGKAIKQLKKLQILGGVKTMRLAAEGWKEEWQTLIAILMSARTRDEVTIIVAERLFSRYKTPDELAKAEPKGVAAIIRPVNFFQNKTRYVITCARVLYEEYGGRPPREHLPPGERLPQEHVAVGGLKILILCIPSAL